MNVLQLDACGNTLVDELAGFISHRHEETMERLSKRVLEIIYYRTYSIG